MPAAIYNFPIEQGSDFSINFIYRDENNNPVNLTGKCVVFQFALQYDVDGGQLYNYRFSSAANSNYDTNNWSLSADNNGNISIRISAELTKDFPALDINGNPIVGLYDLDIISQVNNLRNIRLSTGTITVVPRNFSSDYAGCPTDLNPLVITTPTPTSTITPTGEITPTPTTTNNLDLCSPFDCLDIDLYSKVYTGSSLIIGDYSPISGAVVSTVSGYITTTDTRNIENVEVAINKLSHNHPYDLQIFLAPPSGDKILLSANHKIPNFNNNFSFTFSNRADAGKYLYNASNGNSINICNKTDIVNYNNENLLYSFDHLFNNSVTGVWNLIVRDTDPVGTGMIDSWKLIVTHTASE